MSHTHWNTELLESMQKFQQRLNMEPDAQGVEPTPDRKALTLVISHVETTLDEMFFGHWRTENFKWQTISNEVTGSIELVVTNPITGVEIRRTGAASIIITMDRAPEGLVGAERNRWALNPDNKKPNALDMAFPKLKTECIKNAAQGLGKLFGRDLNRRNADQYRPFKLPTSATPKELPTSTFDKIKTAIAQGEDTQMVNEAMSALRDWMSEEQKMELNNLIVEVSHGDNK
jgi:hypothetical protein